ncbi:6120_t:CDS:2, partial [Dentiscutata heterogama]
MNFASGRLYWELTTCDDLGQLEDFEKYKVCLLFNSTSLNGFKKDFIQQDILDPFYCLTIDLFHDYHLWQCVLGTNFFWIKLADRSKSITLYNIYKINDVIQQSFEKFNSQNVFIKTFSDPDISIDCLPCIDLTLESEFSDKTKLSINEILQSWIVAWKKDEDLNEKDYIHLFIISSLNKLLGVLLSYVILYGQSSDISKITDEIKNTIIINNQNPITYRRYSRNGSTTVIIKNLKEPG